MKKTQFMRRPLLLRLIAVLILGHGPSLVGALPDEVRPPNIVFILVDDLGIKDVGIETPGEAFYETPRIDAFAQKGMRFDQGYTSSPVCSPARASILLGTDPARHGITNWIGASIGVKQAEGRLRSILPPDYVRALPAHDTTVAEAFQAAGYTTAYFGKWHLGDEGSYPEDHGFEINVGGWHSGSPGKGGFFAPYSNPKLENGPDGESLTLRLARETAAYIRAEKEKPFFAMLSFYAVHSPLQTSEELWAKYREKAEAIGWEGDRFEIDRELPVRLVRDHPVYAGMIETLDEAVGLVLDAIEEAGLGENTIVCFTSDHGGVVSGDHYSTSMLPLRGGKGRQWEGGLRVPLYIYAPGVTQPGSRTDVPMTGADFFPTLLDLAGQALLPDQHQDGVSLLPVLKGGTLEDRALFWHYPHYSNQGGDPSSIIRRGDWKLIYYYEDQRRELYNLAEDPGERTDVAARYPEKTAELAAELNAYLVRTAADLPKPWPDYKASMVEQRRERALERKRKLELQHAEFLDPNWAPNPTWWDSSLGED